MLGPVLRYNARAAAPLYAELADVLGVQGSGDAAARSEAFVRHMQHLMDDSGAPRRLRDVGVTAITALPCWPPMR
ncbi:MAG: iron-containing alcohol dehydrogenase [Paracoccus sp. (in: a-proteobacteria)]|uniref:iron-containing alcohol dehydrogenase n=1 Tax=Paracoccus sp. TaxID=267 RepID=UPI0030021BC9